jgi:hypothetical protein
MAILYVQYIGRGKRRATLESDWSFEQTDYYRITTDTATDDPSDFCDDDSDYPPPPGNDGPDSSIPQIGDARNAEALDPTTILYLLRQRWQELSDYVWELAAEYSTKANDPALWDSNPLNQTPVPQWGEETLRVALQADLNGDPFVNSAGDPFAATLLDDICPTITVTQNVAMFTSADILTYAGTVNLNPQWSSAAGAVWLKSHVASQQFRNGVLYYARVSKFIIMGPLTTLFTGGNWCNLKILDMGLRYWNLITEELTPIPAQTHGGAGASRGGGNVTKAVLLNGNGGYNTSDDPTPHYITFKVKNQVDWTPLDLPDGL